MMKTLFLQAPSFDGFDGGAGSRYQNAARDQVVLVSDLAGAAGRAGRGLQADRRAAAPAVGSPTCCRRRKDRDLVVLHTSTPSFASDVKIARGAEGGQPDAQDRPDRRQGGGRADESLAAGLRGDRFRRPQRVRLHHQGGRRGPRLRPTSTACQLSQRRRPRSSTTTTAPILRGHGRAAVRHRRSTSAT